MRKLLNADYVNIYNLIDQTQYNIGALRDSIISPLCANILLYKLDYYIENILIPKYIVGDMHLVLAEYKKRLHLNPKDNAFCKDP
jgi:retron-type reverse transcriptase